MGFILYDLLLKKYERAHVYGIESRADLVQKSQALAQRLGFSQGMTFCSMTVEEARQATQLPSKVDMVTALHACNTATDDAIRFALERKAQYIVLVPCCQAEVAAELRRQKAQSLQTGALAELWRHPIHTREFGSHITNVLRCLLLESHGYKVTVTELVGWEHSMKNELIIARKVAAYKRSARERQLQLLQDCQLQALSHRFVY